MRTLILSLLIGGLSSFLISCFSDENPMSVEGADPNHHITPHPSRPRIPGIIPLSPGNNWSYYYAEYDTALDEKIEFRDGSISLHIDNVYGITSMGDLVKLSYKDTVTYSNFAYEYRYGNEAFGWLISYFDKDIDTMGMYIMGTFDQGGIEKYAFPQLWLAYPASSGLSWDLSQVDLQGNLKRTHYELISTNAQFYIPESAEGISPIRFVDCYVYHEKYDNVDIYRYCNREFGEVGFVKYVNGRRSVTSLLTDFGTRYDRGYYN